MTLYSEFSAQRLALKDFQMGGAADPRSGFSVITPACSETRPEEWNRIPTIIRAMRLLYQQQSSTGGIPVKKYVIADFGLNQVDRNQLYLAATALDLPIEFNNVPPGGRSAAHSRNSAFQYINSLPLDETGAWSMTLDDDSIASPETPRMLAADISKGYDIVGSHVVRIPEYLGDANLDLSSVLARYQPNFVGISTNVWSSLKADDGSINLPLLFGHGPFFNPPENGLAATRNLTDLLTTETGMVFTSTKSAEGAMLYLAGVSSGKFNLTYSPDTLVLDQERRNASVGVGVFEQWGFDHVNSVVQTMKALGAVREGVEVVEFGEGGELQYLHIKEFPLPGVRYVSLFSPRMLRALIDYYRGDFKERKLFNEEALSNLASGIEKLECVLGLIESKLNGDARYQLCNSPLHAEPGELDTRISLAFLAGHSRGHLANPEVFLAFSCGHTPYIPALARRGS